MDRASWWQALERDFGRDAVEALEEVWFPVGLPGFSGTDKARREALLDERFGPDGWRLAHVVRGRVVSPAAAILEYEASYRAYLTARRPLVAFLAATCGNVYDEAVSNVWDDSYVHPQAPSNHYQDVSVRRVIAELATDPEWPEVTPTPTEEVDLVDLGSGESHHVPRAMGFRGGYLLQIREPDSPGFVLSPAVVPVHDPALITTLPNREEWYHREGIGHLSVEAFWQMSKVVEVRWDCFLALGPGRADPLSGI
ncbi:MAG: hypothetical protein FIA92_05935 [Chloroflexi bacterium]|nr:hypothetical protein [Chloroflexota bacterium]